MPLTEQQKNFCREYLTDFTVVSAMKRSGYAVKTAEKQGYLILKNPEIAAYIKELMDNHKAKLDLTAEAVLFEIKKLAFSDHIGFYKWSDKKKKYVLKAPEELTADQRAAVSEYKPGEYYKLYSKDAALDKLAKYFKLYSEIDATVTNFVMMPTMKYGGKEVVFEVGRPAPKTPGKNKN